MMNYFTTFSSRTTKPIYQILQLFCYFVREMQFFGSFPSRTYWLTSPQLLTSLLQKFFDNAFMIYTSSLSILEPVSHFSSDII